MNLKNKKILNLFLYGDDWVRHLSDVLNERPDLGIRADYFEYPEIRPWRIFLKAMHADVLMRVGVRPGAKGKRLYLLDIMWFLFEIIWPSKSIVYYWIGTDVLDALRDSSNVKSHIFQRKLKKAFHFSNAPWLADELKTIGINSEVVLFPVGKVTPPKIEEIEWSQQFTILTYIPDGRFEFYGGRALVKSALRMPNTRFVVVGGDGKWLEKIPSNLFFLGYVNNMAEVINKAHVVVRQVEHDAIGGTVREGLFYAKHVVYSYPIENTHLVMWGDSDGLYKTLALLEEKFKLGQLEPNLEGRKYATATWNPDVLLEKFASSLFRI